MSATKKAAPVIDLGLCRCCGTMKRCRFLNVEYMHLGNKEIYSEMIMDCFGLLISYMDSKPLERLICATCVTRLREATAFRKQVLLCEEAFLQMKIIDHGEASPPPMEFSSSTLQPPRLEVQVKMEVEDAEPSPTDYCHAMGGEDAGDGTGHASSAITKPELMNEDSTSNDDLPLHNFITQHANERPEKVNPRPEKVNPRSEEVNPRPKRSIPRPERLDPRPAKAIIKSRRSKNLRLDPTATNKGINSPSTLKNVHRVNTFIDGVAAIPKMPMSKMQEMMRERDPSYKTETNTLTIIEHSYACPFKCRHNNLLCYYCGEYFSKPDLLREHTEKTHNPKKFKISDNSMIKVDLTRIDCRLCDIKINDLNTLKDHLTSVHSKKCYSTHKESILPFKLDQELKCAICESKFQYFHALNKHMNVHYSNYVCETCGLGFVDRGRFLMHQQRHEIGDFPCGQCGKVFKAQVNRDLHIDRVHEKRARVYCPKCDVKLMTYHHKLKHLVEVHGEEPLSFPCDMCERVFANRRMLTVHRRKEHFKDFRYECQYCGQKFFTRFALTNHTPTHTLERNFVCEICEKAYPRLKTLKDHMRIHSNDRRYRCQICGQGFIQNCSLKGHMKSQHSEYG